ncbi:AfsR/SARP family transcriptional regulator [Kitasatospora sp. NPDC097643]|uniref:AfsR/SARP family transcriptional regulator n=1 Tax=Kitasatospora sp. NPDC097643 TaxID=3157230 RepID=UPI00332BC2CB
MLGPFTARDAGASIAPTAAKPRQLLALFALNVNQIVSISELMEELWGAELPRSAPTTLQTYVLQLRRKLQGGSARGSVGPADRVLATRPGGYVLEADPAAVDAVEFDRLAGAGHAAMAVGDMESASRLLGAALACWRGPALAGLRRGRYLDIEVTRLEQSRITVLERRISADLRLGRHHELTGELEELTHRDPLHEGLHAHLMTALHRTGRPDAALAVYRRIHGALVDQLGLEPGDLLQRLHHAIAQGWPLDRADQAFAEPAMAFSGSRAG